MTTYAPAPRASHGALIDPAALSTVATGIAPAFAVGGCLGLFIGGRMRGQIINGKVVAASPAYTGGVMAVNFGIAAALYLVSREYYFSPALIRLLSTRDDCIDYLRRRRQLLPESITESEMISLRRNPETYWDLQTRRSYEGALSGALAMGVISRFHRGKKYALTGAAFGAVGGLGLQLFMNFFRARDITHRREQEIRPYGAVVPDRPPPELDSALVTPLELTDATIAANKKTEIPLITQYTRGGKYVSEEYFIDMVSRRRLRRKYMLDDVRERLAMLGQDPMEIGDHEWSAEAAKPSGHQRNSPFSDTFGEGYDENIRLAKMHGKRRRFWSRPQGFNDTDFFEKDDY